MKLCYILIPVILLFNQTVIGQVTTTEEPKTMAQEMPIYPGGDAAMSRDIGENLKYPKKEKRKNIEGKVYVQFVVEKDGSVSNVKVLRGIPNGPGLNETALNAIKNLKNFTPAKIDGEPVRLTMTVPINFKLN